MITIVVGAQYGGEGKGKIAAYLASEEAYAAACRCGGPNSSHTVVWKGKTHRLRMMPTAAVVNPAIAVYFGAGTLIHLPTLSSEIAEINFKGQVVIDPKAGIITDDIIQHQREDLRYVEIGSTLTGTGYASAMRCQRALKLAKDYRIGHPQVECSEVAIALQRMINHGRSILIEGHQGFGLSNYHGDYPYTSSRDSTAASMLAEIGLGPRQENLRIVLAVKIFPTRNHAGRLDGELSNKEIRGLGIHEEGGGAWDIPNRPRRVGMLDFKIVERAIIANSPTEIALTGADYLAKFPAAKDHLYKLILTIKEMGGIDVRYVSTGPKTEEMIDRTKERKHLSLGGGEEQILDVLFS